MPTIDKTELHLYYKSRRTIEIAVTDDNGDPVNLEATGTDFGILFARNKESSAVAATSHYLSADAHLVVDDTDNNVAVLTLEDEHYDDLILAPRIEPHWFNAWYKAPSEEGELIGHGPVYVHHTVEPTWPE